ncbi:MAG: porin, partial [Methyloprofundus sp.]|nr:porin [Methyloprofundus sp.]
HTDGTEVRRARIHMKGVLWNDWKYVSEFDFADNEVTIKDLSVSYRGLEHLQITLGHQKQNMSMELQESSNDIMFIERSAVNSLTEKTFNRALGLHLKSASKDWSVQLGVYGDSTDKNKNPGDEGWGISGRGTYTPINTKSQVLHLGAAVGYRGMEDGKVKLGYETTHMSNLYLTKASPKNVHSNTMGIAELAYMYGPFSVQSEYAHMWLARNDGQSGLNFDAWYVQAAWTLTGESRSYKGSDGEFKRLKPSQEFGFGEGSGWGAVELALRYDESDLNSGDINGGSERAFTLAANWYLNQNIRLMANYRTAFDVDPSEDLVIQGGAVADNVHAFTGRIQLTF